MGDADFPQLMGNNIANNCKHLNVFADFLYSELDRHGLIHINLRLSHRGATFTHFCGKLNNKSLPSFKSSKMEDLKSFDNLWPTKLNLARWILGNSF